MTAVADTGPLLVFAKLQRLHLLAELYTEILIPQAVFHEAVTVGQERGYADAVLLQTFVSSHPWPVVPLVVVDETLAGAQLGTGEQQAISIAKAQGMLLLIDDMDARHVAEQVGVTTRGSLGVLVQAHRQGMLTDAELDELLATIENCSDIWINPELCQRLRRTLLNR